MAKKKRSVPLSEKESADACVSELLKALKFWLTPRVRLQIFQHDDGKWSGRAIGLDGEGKPYVVRVATIGGNKFELIGALIYATQISSGVELKKEFRSGPAILPNIHDLNDPWSK